MDSTETLPLSFQIPFTSSTCLAPLPTSTLLFANSLHWWFSECWPWALKLLHSGNFTLSPGQPLAMTNWLENIKAQFFWFKVVNSEFSMGLDWVWDLKSNLHLVSSPSLSCFSCSLWISSESSPLKNPCAQICGSGFFFSRSQTKTASKCHPKHYSK